MKSLHDARIYLTRLDVLFIILEDTYDEADVVMKIRYFLKMMKDKERNGVYRILLSTGAVITHRPSGRRTHKNRPFQLYGYAQDGTDISIFTGFGKVIYPTV
jgi:hypothetical protein